MLPEWHVAVITFRNIAPRNHEGFRNKHQFELPPRPAIRNDRLIYDVILDNRMRRAGFIRGKRWSLPPWHRDAMARQTRGTDVRRRSWFRRS